jgi:predicted NBD/HSP70 family sugar kinase
VERLSAFVIGSPGVVDPRTGDPLLAINLPEWHEGVLEGLRGALRKPVLIENDVNLAAIAERSAGAASGFDDFVLLWVGVGLGLATVLGGRLHRGASGAAGEIGWLPMPGAPITSHVRTPSEGGLQWLAGAESVRTLAAGYGFQASRARDCVRAAVAARSSGTDDGSAEAFLGELAHRIALGTTAVCAVLDPGLVVLGGEVGLAGGTVLADLVASEVAGMCPVPPRVVPTAVSSEPVLRGALLTAVEQARADLLSSVAAVVSAVG